MGADAREAALAKRRRQMTRRATMKVDEIARTRSSALILPALDEEVLSRASSGIRRKMRELSIPPHFRLAHWRYRRRRAARESRRAFYTDESVTSLRAKVSRRSLQRRRSYHDISPIRCRQRPSGQRARAREAPFIHRLDKRGASRAMRDDWPDSRFHRRHAAAYFPLPAERRTG